jgi:hypothetical protein
MKTSLLTESSLSNYRKKNLTRNPYFQAAVTWSKWSRASKKPHPSQYFNRFDERKFQHGCRGCELKLIHADLVFTENEQSFCSAECLEVVRKNTTPTLDLNSDGEAIREKCFYSDDEDTGIQKILDKCW